MCFRIEDENSLYVSICLSAIMCIRIVCIGCSFSLIFSDGQLFVQTNYFCLQLIPFKHFLWAEDQHDATEFVEASLIRNQDITEVSLIQRLEFMTLVTKKQRLTNFPLFSTSSLNKLSRSLPKLWKPQELLAISI